MARVWDTGFESGVVTYEFPDAYPGYLGITAERTATYAQSGCYAAHFAYPAGIYARHQLPANSSKLWHAFSMYLNTTTAGSVWIYHWRDDSNSWYLGSLRTTTAIGTLELYSGSIWVATGTKVLVPGQRYNMELLTYINGISGSLILKINGVTDISYSGNTAPVVGSPRYAGFGGDGGVHNMYIDDWTVNDDTGGADNTWVGDVRYVPMEDSASSASTALTNSGAGNNYTAIDDHASGAPDNDTTYVYGAAASLADLYTGASPAMSGSEIYKAVHVLSISRKTNSATDSGQLHRLAVGAGHIKSACMSLGVTYDMYKTRWTTNPSGGDWAASHFGTSASFYWGVETAGSFSA